MEPGSVRVTMDIPEELAAGASAGALAEEARRLLVLDRFRRGDLSAALAARILGLRRVAFLEVCGAYEIPVLGFDRADFERELEQIRAAGR